MNYLIKNAAAIFQSSVEVDSTATPQDIRVSAGIITEIGYGLLAESEEVIDVSGCVIYPGLVNTHHHIAQSILKGIPEGLNQPLGDWLASVPYRFWPYITPEIMYHSACLGFYELLRSGCTTCADHHYLYHSNTSPELEAAVWQAAKDMGIRLILCRGGATVQGTHKGLLNSGIKTETLEQTFNRLDNSLTLYHQPGGNAMQKLVVAPTSLIHSSTKNDLKLLAEYARSHQLKMHSHLLEVSFDEQQAQQKYTMSAVEYAESCHWLGDDVWFAHLVKANRQDIKKLASTKTGIAHCPTSNCRLGSGIAPVIDMYKAGMPISIGVDGSASSESGSMIQELNLTWLLHRSQHGADATKLEMILKWGSEDGAKLLGLDLVGKIEVGYAADLVCYDLNTARFSGSHSELMSPVMCGEPVSIKHAWVNGHRVIKGGISKIKEESLIENVYRAIESLKKRIPTNA